MKLYAILEFKIQFPFKFYAWPRLKRSKLPSDKDVFNEIAAQLVLFFHEKRFSNFNRQKLNF